MLHDEDSDTVFRRALDNELEKICSFYQLKELEIYGEVGDLLKDEEAFEAETDGLDLDHLETVDTTQGKGFSRSSISGRTRHQSIFQNFGFGGGAVGGGRRRRASTMSASIHDADEEHDSDEDADELAALNKSTYSLDRRKTGDSNAKQSIDDFRNSRDRPASKRRASLTVDENSDMVFSALLSSSMTLKKRTIGLYVSLCELKSFIQLNKTGFSKVLKKYDKTVNRNLKSTYVKDSVNPAYPFRQVTMQHLDDNIDKIEKSYAELATKGDMSTAKRELRLHLREHVVWERNTVWREMIGIERKAQAANLGLGRTLLGGDHDPSKARLQGDEAEESPTKEIYTPIGRYRCPRWLFSSTFFMLFGIIILFVLMLVIPIMEKPEQQNCLAMLVFVSLLWATEVRSRTPAQAGTRSDHLGHTFVCNGSASAVPRSCSESRTRRPETSSPARTSTSHQICLCFDVDACHHAVTRWFYHRCSALEISHCEAHGDVCPKQSWYSASYSLNYQHVRCHDPEHVD